MTESKQASEGGHLTIDIPPINSYPMPGHQSTETKWFKGESQIPSNDIRYHVSLSMQLVLLDIQSSINQAKFRTQFFNLLVDEGPTQSKSFELSVTGT